jgi:cyclic beta-1,2-glucan synthetase
MNYSQYSSDLLEDDKDTSEVLGIDRLEHMATLLAQDLDTANKSIKEKNLLPEVRKASSDLLDAYLFLTKDISSHKLTPASVWFLDNFHIIEDQLRSIKRDLPKDFYDELPKVNDGEFAGYPRVYAMAYTFIAKTDSRLELSAIKKFVNAFQTVTPLTIGELWALAITFRISLIKQLKPLVDRIIFCRHKIEEADKIADEVLLLATKTDTKSEDLIKVLTKNIGQQPKFNRPLIVQLIQRLRDQEPIVTRAYDWLEELLQSCSTSTVEVVKLEHYRQAAAQVTIGNIISSMRLISNIDWHDFFEAVSLVDPILRTDPLESYSLMDRATRDSYRKVIERISKGSNFSEIEVARKAIEIAGNKVLPNKEEVRKKHVGHYLIDEGVFELEKQLEYKQKIKERIVRFIDEDPTYFYFGVLTLLMIFFIAVILKVFLPHTERSTEVIALLILIVIPISELSISILNYGITLLRLPKKLPRMDTEKGIGDENVSMVVTPCLLSGHSVIHDLMSNLEVQYLANQDPNIYFAILGDLEDAMTETTNRDKDLLAYAQGLIEELNQRYAPGNRARFYLFHRSRHYNSSEGKWICWERKRGKILEFNRLLRGDKNTTFITQDLDYDFLKSIFYVITLDADTQLPLQSARRLIGTITHPLNRPVYSKKSNRIIAGYGILQPRISVSIVSAAKTKFSNVFSGNTGIDPYTTAVSDVYQDLFSEGSFTGKGLYVVDAFEQVIGDKIPENCVLSHDLLEGSYARVGLTTDIELIDDFPSSFETFAKRMHRWTRGDWQIALWLLPFVPNCKNKWVRNKLSLISRWKIFDNLRRSLITPIILLWLLLGWTVLPGNPLGWTIAVIITMSFPVYAPSLRDLLRRSENPWREQLATNIKEFKNRLIQIFLMVIFMPPMALGQIDAIIRALYRMVISKKKLLEWVTFSQTQVQMSKEFKWKDVISSGPVFSILSTVLIIYSNPSSLMIAWPFLLAWSLSPLASLRTKERAKPRIKTLEPNEISEYRRYARITWHFFETFARENNNWLAPDNFQEDPQPVVAHRTSPTNIGLQFLSILSAYDLGYIGFREMVDLLEKGLGSLTKLEKMEGHFYNWYNTLTLTPLEPRYVSSVDSGNLAGHLLVLKQACLKLSEGPYINPNTHKGLKDSIDFLYEILKKTKKDSLLKTHGSLEKILQELDKLNPVLEQEKWEETLHLAEDCKALIKKTLINDGSDLFNQIMNWMDCIVQQTISFREDQLKGHADLPGRLKTIASLCQDIYLEMNFKFLYDEERKIFSIGYNATDGRRDDSYYDLLASESRLTSFFAIAKGDVPDEHWFRLGRQLTSVVGSRALVSWSATMFEYLMPLLVMRRYESTLLDQTYDSVVLRQIEYANQRQIPWGISEAGYNARDLNFNYQYGPFGIPGLGLKRGLRDELVISPYSTMLAAMVFPQSALVNLQHMEKLGAFGNYGFYESIDYTKERVPKDKRSVILKSYMAHHQGMSLIAINNLLNKSIMQRRFHADPRVKAVQLLLQERIPSTTQMAKPRAEETHIESFARFSENHHTRIYTDPALSTPRTQIISNGNYSVMLSTAGAGYSKCEERMVTRWREDPTQDDWGQYIYIQNIDTQKIWSAGFQPMAGKPKLYEAHFSEDKVEFLRSDHGISTHTEIIISSEDNVEMRRVSLTNNTDQAVEIEVTSYMEVVLAKANDDAAHPAFSNLFIQTEFRPETSSLLANRRLRSSSDQEVWGLHILTLEGDAAGPLQYETDRSRFIGRGRSVRNPIILTNEIDLTNTVGAVLDPIFSLRQRIKIKPHQTARVTFSTGLVYSRVEALRVSEKYHDPNIFIRQVNLGWIKAQINLRYLNITMENAHIYQRLAGRIIYLAPYLRAQSEILAANTKNQSALWAYGISGDLPILLTRIKDEKDMEMIRQLLRGHEYLRSKGLKIDLVILNEHATSYMQDLQDELMRQILISGSHSLLDKPGGIFIRRADLIPPEDLILIKSLARISLYANKGTLYDQLRRRPHEKELPPRFIPTTQKKDYPRVHLEKMDLVFDNGLGGFTSDGHEYVITLKNDQWTPAPWINVVANQNGFGFIISESGSSYTWSVNSRENRLSTWSNDPVSDPPSEVIYIRDEESGAYWSPTPLPIRGHEPYIIRHGQGYSKFQHNSNGLSHELTMFVPLNASVKILKLKLKNLHKNERKLSVTGYIEWVLGFSRSQTAQTLYTKWDEGLSAVLAKNSYNNEFSNRIAFITTNESTDIYTCSRKEFIGRNGSMDKPASMLRTTLSSRSGGRNDPCGAIQTKIHLSSEQEHEIIILIGQGEDEEEARNFITFFKNKQNVEEAFLDVKRYWDETLTTITIKTPDPSMDLLVNRWLLYQTLACRIWARSAFYQSGGAFGFRDQLQDVMAMVYTHPEITRDQIVLAASRQFPEGDVQHWWHPPTGRGVRTRFSDDLLWLPFVTNYYVEVSGDESVLDEIIPFIETDLLKDGHDETYTQPSLSEEKESLYDHCSRALDKSMKLGSHGLPLMGSGDWNDGMSRVGHLGKGESVWLAWFLIKTLRGFIPLCERRKDHDRAKKYLLHIEKLKESIETNAWDGNWYLRAYFDNGEKLGSQSNEECKIDAIAQSWSLLSGEENIQRSRTALEAVDKYLIDWDNKIVKLFTPPFDKGSTDPGYIKGYVPGVRENGGQYTHAAIWTMMAYASINDNKTANELFSLINPINRSSTKTGSQRYKVEPYVIAADIYGVDPHVGRGGWSWYTGSASWMYRAAIESILGFRIHNGLLTVTPCIPNGWEQFEISYRLDKTTFNITVINNHSENTIEYDGTAHSKGPILLVNDGSTHNIIIKIQNTSL